ncbi:MAG: nicotinamide-nucleotide amidohydrolase family protein [Actinomycetota bacterium]|nr:nicotinamide-nucleotide amidohydrolase family protein [Actinomycetota bacterium]
MTEIPGSGVGTAADTGVDARALAVRLIDELTRRGLTIAVAESLTGGLVVAELIAVPGASAVVRGGVVAYATELKASLLGVDAALLAEKGPIDAEVARQMAEGVRWRLGHDGAPADVGLATTGVAGPDSQDGHPVGEVWIGVAIGEVVTAHGLTLTGDRASIRSAVVSESLARVLGRLPE